MRTITAPAVDQHPPEHDPKHPWLSVPPQNDTHDVLHTQLERQYCRPHAHIAHERWLVPD
jgi:hypothetical protein